MVSFFPICTQRTLTKKLEFSDRESKSFTLIVEERHPSISNAINMIPNLLITFIICFIVIIRPRRFAFFLSNLIFHNKSISFRLHSFLFFLIFCHRGSLLPSGDTLQMFHSYYSRHALIFQVSLIN